MAEYEMNETQKIMDKGKFEEAFKSMIQMSRPDLIIKTGFQYLQRLITESTRKDVLQHLRVLDSKISQEDIAKLREISPNFDFLFEYLYFKNACDNKQDMIVQEQLRKFIDVLKIPRELYRLIYDSI